MKRIRIGNTITQSFVLKFNGEAIDPAEHDVQICLLDPCNHEVGVSVKYEENKVLATLQGVSQTKVGVYRMVIWVNRGKTDQAVCDFDFVELVESCKDVDRYGNYT